MGHQKTLCKRPIEQCHHELARMSQFHWKCTKIAVLIRVHNSLYPPVTEAAAAFILSTFCCLMKSSTGVNPPRRHFLAVSKRWVQNASRFWNTWKNTRFIELIGNQLFLVLIFTAWVTPLPHFRIEKTETVKWKELKCCSTFSHIKSDFVSTRS